MTRIFIYTTIILALMILAWITVSWILSRSQASKPLISLVYFLSRPRKFLRQDVQDYAARAFGSSFIEDDPDATEFVIEDPLDQMEGLNTEGAQSFIIKVREGIFILNSFSMPYFSNQEDVAKGIGDLRLRKAVASHRAWISVDAMTESDDEEEKAETYRSIAQMMVQLADDDCLAIYCPELQACNEYDELLLAPLSSDQPLELFRKSTFDPVIEIPEDDEFYVKSVEEAHRRWPEFLAAFRAKKDGDRTFLLKARFDDKDNTEFMWITVTGIEGDTIHGILESNPLDLTGFKKGQEVTVSLAEMNDWIFSEGGRPVGGFSRGKMDRPEE